MSLLTLIYKYSFLSSLVEESFLLSRLLKILLLFLIDLSSSIALNIIYLLENLILDYIASFRLLDYTFIQLLSLRISSLGITIIIGKNITNFSILVRVSQARNNLISMYLEEVVPCSSSLSLGTLQLNIILLALLKILEIIYNPFQYLALIRCLLFLCLINII